MPDTRSDAILWRTGMITMWHDTCFTDAQRHNVTASAVTFRRRPNKLPGKSAGTRRAYDWRAGRSGKGMQMERSDQVIADLTAERAALDDEMGAA